MNKATPPSVKKSAPEFSKLHAIKDGVLVCTEKDGNVERFRYIPLNQVMLESGLTLERHLQVIYTRMEDLQTKLHDTIEADIKWKTETNELLAKLIAEIQKGE
jgi:hypothetical protein